MNNSPYTKDKGNDDHITIATDYIVVTDGPMPHYEKAYPPEGLKLFSDDGGEEYGESE